VTDTQRLERLAERTRELLEDMDRARPELLSIAELNRAMRQLLANQAALLETLARRDLSESQAAARPQIKVTPTLIQPEDTSTPPTEAPGLEAEEVTDEGEGGERSETVLGPIKTVPGYVARQFIEQFDNRDKDYDKGLEKMNRWIAAGTSGTPFQWRGDRAYLNLNGAGSTSARNYQEQLMTRMGFSRRVGRLEVPGLDGEVVVYERPAG
jgi:hypothetical protein